jgi:hypothetical protein
LPSQYILLNESGKLSNYVGEYAEAAQGMSFLIINMTIENHGYTGFSVNPNYFAVIIDKVAYPYDKATFSTKNPLSTPTLLDGGKIGGYLVFQIPKGKTQYLFRYTGSGDYRVIYGDLVEAQAPQEKPQPKLPERTTTFNIGDGMQTLNPASIVSQANAIIQSTTIDLGDNGYAIMEVKTYQAAINGDQAINDALKIEKINGFNVNDVGTYDATLANGNTVKVYQRNCAAIPVHRGNFVVSAFMPDSSTVVKVTSTFDKYRFQTLLGSLKIGEMPSA